MAERRTRRTGLARLRPLLPLALIWTAGCCVLVGLALQRQVPYDELLLDPNNVAGVPWYTGLVSNLGILGWTTASATAFFGAWIAHVGQRPAAARMLIEGALLSTLLLFDDLLQLHVLVKPLLGLPKAAAYGFYLAVALHWVGTQWRELRRTRAELLVAAGGAFALSVGLDQVSFLVPWLSTNQLLLAEDAAKFLGVLAWAQFYVMTSGAIVTSIVGQLRAAAQRADGQATATDPATVTTPPATTSTATNATTTTATVEATSPGRPSGPPPQAAGPAEASSSSISA